MGTTITGYAITPGTGYGATGASSYGNAGQLAPVPTGDGCDPSLPGCRNSGALRVDPNTTTGQRDPNVWTPYREGQPPAGGPAQY
jgi:hypothetical protein